MYDLTTIQAINIAAKIGLKEPTTPESIEIVGCIALGIALSNKNYNQMVDVISVVDRISKQ